MAISSEANNLPTNNEPTASEAKPSPARPRKKNKNVNQIHARPLPLETHPLPAFHPSNPISLLRLAYAFISHLWYPPTSHPEQLYTGSFSPETRSVHVMDPKDVRALWEMGFFGKGTLSRSEPSWLEREQARLREGKGRAAEDATNARREERRLFKLERARAERERIERQRLVEEGKVGEAAPLEPPGTKGGDEDPPVDEMNGGIDGSREPKELHVEFQQVQPDVVLGSLQHPRPTGLDSNPVDLKDQEHLQLTLEEAFFLSYGLGVLSVLPATLTSDQYSPPMSPKSLRPRQYSTCELFRIFCQHSLYPPTPPDTLAPDDPFLLNYVTYHHFRSLGWVVRPGIKFGVDYLLYNRGPVFSHAAFAVVIVPSYTHRYWNSPGGRGQRRVGEGKDWWWLHGVNRVQNAVKKTLVLCYVEVPSPFEVDLTLEGEDGIGEVLGMYRVREFVIRRWLANRSRD